MSSFWRSAPSTLRQLPPPRPLLDVQRCVKRSVSSLQVWRRRRLRRPTRPSQRPWRSRRSSWRPWAATTATPTTTAPTARTATWAPASVSSQPNPPRRRFPFAPQQQQQRCNNTLGVQVFSREHFGDECVCAESESRLVNSGLMSELSACVKCLFFCTCCFCCFFVRQILASFFPKLL